MQTSDKKAVLKEIKEIAGILGRTPTQRQFSIYSRKFKGDYVVDLFGSWNTALWEAGMTLNMVKTKTLNKKSLVEKLQVLAKKLGRSPLLKDIEEIEGFPSQTQFYRAFGSWSEALNTAGLKLNKWSDAAGDSQHFIISWIRDFHDKYGHVPSVEDIHKDNNAPSIHVVRRVFGNFSLAIKAAGFIPRRFGQTKRQG
ncbi:MAG TPA: hypothetical protein ENG80_00820 [Nitrospirae bacterium]|nr:hypothetical protein [Nitrospirota bacterium]HDH51253.1 hypothetical protein [Nitrospirota bacterium]HDK81034.1 hypothetical protein [Nitrospirota bacterium]